MNYYSEMLDIKFHEDRRKNLQQFEVFQLIYVFSASISEIIVETNKIFTHARSNVQGCMVQNFVEID